VPGRTKRRAADLSHAFGQRIGHAEDLIALIVQQQMIVAEMRTRHVPMEVLGFHVEGEHVRKERGQRS